MLSFSFQVLDIHTYSIEVMHAMRSPTTMHSLTKPRLKPNLLSNPTIRTVKHAAAGSPPNTTTQNLSLTLPDGRTLGYAEYGHPTGHPLLFFHGWPSSRLEGWGAHAVARRLGIRVIAADRPGFGISSFQRDRCVLDWVRDVDALTETLGLEKFAVLGGSGGGPYALAVAYAESRGSFQGREKGKRRLSGVGLMSPAGPWEPELTRDIPFPSRALCRLASSWPGSLRVGTEASVGMMRWAASTRPVARWLDRWLANVNRGKDLDDSPDELREKMLRILFEGFAQGAEGAVHEAKLLTLPWGFPLQDARYDTVKVWHGKQDRNAPISMARYMVQRMPHAVLKEFDGDNHFTMVNHLEKILKELVPEAEAGVS